LAGYGAYPAGRPKNELISGKKFYIWELIHQNQVVVAYEDVRDMVKAIEATENRYVNGFLAASVILLFIAYVRKLSQGCEK
jgi:hypothetical protein